MTAPGDRLRILYNPAAGVRRGPRIEEVVRAHGGDAVLLRTEAPGHAVELARAAAAAGCRIVAAAGGDGTVNEVARGLVGSATALGIIPTGSGNGLARHLGLPLDPAAALARLDRPRFERIDTGRINGRLFVCTAGIGFDAHVSRHFAAVRRRGFLSYIRVAVQRYTRYAATPVAGEIAGRAFAGDCYLMAFANASQYGNDARIAPHADLSDGILDICLIDRLPLWRAMRVGHALMAGTLPASGAAAFHTADRVTVRAERPMEFHVDGDCAGEDTRFDVALAPSSLLVAA